MHLFLGWREEVTWLLSLGMGFKWGPSVTDENLQRFGALDSPPPLGFPLFFSPYTLGLGASPTTAPVF